MPAGVMSRVGQVLDRVAGGGWLEFAGGPAAALAASHLRSPATFTVQLDHLLSSVSVINHSRPENGAHFWAPWQKSWEILHCRQAGTSAGWRHAPPPHRRRRLRRPPEPRC